VLVGVDLSDTNTLDDLFKDGVIKDVELIMDSAPSLTSMDGLEALGIKVSDTGITLEGAWKAATDVTVPTDMADAGYEAYSNDGGLTILVQKNVMESGG
jgi:hypothetical protein